MLVKIAGTYRLVHHLVLEAFVGSRPPGTECCHNDDDPANNRLSNLRWDTHLANMGDMKRRGRSLSGTRNPNAKLTEAGVREIRRRADGGESLWNIARERGMTYQAIRGIVSGCSWVHVPLAASGAS
jgi:hypothetical protein